LGTESPDAAGVGGTVAKSRNYSGVRPGRSVNPDLEQDWAGKIPGVLRGGIAPRVTRPMEVVPSVV
jgi:hypothetical protein